MDFEKIIDAMGQVSKFNYFKSLPFIVDNKGCWFMYKFEQIDETKFDVIIDETYVYYSDNFKKIDINLNIPIELSILREGNYDHYYEFLYEEFLYSKNIEDVNIEKMWAKIEEIVLPGLVKVYKEIEKELK